MRTMRSTVDLEDGGTEVRMSSDSRSRSAAKASADRTARRRAFCILGKRRSPRVGRDDNLYVEGAHERTRQRSTPPLIHTMGWRAGGISNLQGALRSNLAPAFGFNLRKASVIYLYGLLTQQSGVGFNLRKGQYSRSHWLQ